VVVNTTEDSKAVCCKALVCKGANATIIFRFAVTFPELSR